MEITSFNHKAHFMSYWTMIQNKKKNKTELYWFKKCFSAKGEETRSGAKT